MFASCFSWDLGVDTLSFHVYGTDASDKDVFKG